jgi:hypothetical protein
VNLTASHQPASAAPAARAPQKRPAACACHCLLPLPATVTATAPAAREPNSRYPLPPCNRRTCRSRLTTPCCLCPPLPATPACRCHCRCLCAHFPSPHRRHTAAPAARAPDSALLPVSAAVAGTSLPHGSLLGTVRRSPAHSPLVKSRNAWTCT